MNWRDLARVKRLSRVNGLGIVTCCQPSYASYLNDGPPLARGEVGIQPAGKITAVGPDFITYDAGSDRYSSGTLSAQPVVDLLQARSLPTNWPPATQL